MSASTQAQTRRHGGRHAAPGRPSTKGAGPLIAGMAVTFAGIPFFLWGISLLLRYSPYEDPGVLKPGYILTGFGTIMLLTPAITGLVRFVVKERQRMNAWKATLPPAERRAVEIGEVAGLAALGFALNRHASQTSERLSASVMGEPHGG